MSLLDRTTVLIVGAGPAGLTAALSLLHHGLRDFTIVDALQKGANASRSVNIHAATLEALDSIGCWDDFISQGIKVTSLNVSTRSGKLFSPCMQSLASRTRHPYILSITQNVTERTLENRLTSLGVHIRRPLKMTGMKPNADDPCLSDVRFEDGTVITTKYVIGADGARSMVRTTAGIGFSDPTIIKGEVDNNLAQMVYADVMFDNMSGNDKALGAVLSPDNLFVCFPFPPSFNQALASDSQPFISEVVYRIGCGVPLSEGEIPRSPSKEYLQSLVDRFGSYHLSSDPSVNPNPKTTHIKEIIWHTRFRTHSSAADTMFTRLGSGEPGEGGIVLLIGDAAHIHPPLGGQGVNLGMRDAIFLGEALVKHMHAAEIKPLFEADAILREYADTRHTRALEMIKFTKGLLSVGGMKHREWYSWWCPIDSVTVRTWVLWTLGHFRFFQNKMGWELSGLGRR